MCPYGILMLDADLLQRLMTLIGDLPKRQPHPSASKRLDALFKQLKEPHPPAPFFELEDLIWAIWIDDVAAAPGEQMQKAIKALAAKQLDEAQVILDNLIATMPNWAEAWNKRATLHFIAGRDEASLIDILATLTLEPRHFGALAGMGQLCLRNDEPELARIAFTAAFTIHPHMQGLKSILADLGAEIGTAH